MLGVVTRLRRDREKEQRDGAPPCPCKKKDNVGTENAGRKEGTISLNYREEQRTANIKYNYFRIFRALSLIGKASNCRLG